MILIAGLGNPGKKYENTRHNLGFAVLEPDYDFVWQKKFNAKIARPNQSLIIALPQAFMNNSGPVVSKIAKYYKIKSGDIWIVHDDLDLPLGEIRLQKNRSSAGHRGVESIIQSLGTKDFVRFRIGIMSAEKGRLATDDFVLRKFSDSEKTKVKKIITKTREIITYARTGGITKAISEMKKITIK